MHRIVAFRGLETLISHGRNILEKCFPYLLLRYVSEKRMRLRGGLATWAQDPKSNSDPVSVFSASLVHALFPVERRPAI